MKRLLALLLAVALTAGLCGCSMIPELRGSYKTTIDLYDSVVKTFDGENCPTDLSIANHLSEFTLTIRYDFLLNGTYRVTLDRNALTNSVADLKAALLEVIEARFVAAACKEFAQYGIPLETKADVEDLLGCPFDELFFNSMGITMEEYAENAITDSFVSVLDTDYTLIGKFKAMEGMLYLSDSNDSEVPEDRYEMYTINEDGSVTVTEGVNMPTDEVYTYPYTLTKIS